MPHADVRGVINMLEEYYATVALKGGYTGDKAWSEPARGGSDGTPSTTNPTQPDVIRERRRPGSEMTEAERKVALEWANEKWNYVAEEIFEYEFRDINLPKAGSLLAGTPDRNDRDTQLVRMRVDVMFTPDVVWSSFVQYDNRSDRAGLNSRFRYILRDGREFFLVVNQGVTTSDDDLEFTRTETLVKGVWTLTF